MKALLLASALALSLSGCIGYIHDNGHNRDDGRWHDRGHFDPGPRGSYTSGPRRDNRYYCPPDRIC